MTEPQQENYNSDNTPGFFARLPEKAVGSDDISTLKAAAAACAVTAISGILIAIAILSLPFMLPCLYALVSSVISFFLLASTSRAAWVLFTSALSLSLVYSILLIFIFGFIVFGVAVSLFYLAVLIYVMRNSVRARFSVTPAAAYSTVAVSMATWIILLITQ